jgi:hypothetical protein
LVPKDILRNLPIAESWSDIDYVASVNEDVRRRVNEIIGSTWKQATRLRKLVLRSFLLQNPELLRSLLDAYGDKPAVRYNFGNDPAGQVAWYWASQRLLSRTL